MSDKVDKYADPQGILPLRDKISKKLLEEHMSYAPDEILVTSGAIEGISATIFGLTNPDDEILIPTPTYSAFFNIARVAKLRIKMFPLNEEKNWEIDPDKLKKFFTEKTKIMIICNPNNPTGTIYDKNKLQKICTVAQEQGIHIILDETYRNI